METKIDYKMQSYRASQKQQKLRDTTWETKRCQDLYKKLINYAGGINIVRPGMKGTAKQLVITCCLKNIEPNFEEFKDNVQKANSINDNRKSKSRLVKHNEKIENSFKNQEGQINKIMDDIWHEFGVAVKFFSRPYTVEDAWDLYYKIKQNENIRNTEIW